MLDLFNGKISLSEILNTDISLLLQLRNTKIELQQEIEAASKNTDGIKMVTFESVKNRLVKGIEKDVK